MAGAGRGGAWGRSCPVPPRRSRSSAAPQPHLPRGQSAQPAVRTRRRRPIRYGGAGGRGEARGRGELLGEQPEGPGGGRRQSRRASRVFPCGIPGGRSALGGSRAERPPGMGVLRVWGDPGYSSCAGGARVPTVPAGRSSAPALGGTTGPTTAPAPGYCHPWSTPNFGYLHPRVVPPWGGSVPHSRAISVPPVSPCPCYRHCPRNLPAGYSRLRSISVSGVPQSPAKSRFRYSLPGVSLSPFPGVFPPPRHPHPRAVSVPRGVFPSPGYPHPGPLVSCVGPRGATLPQDGWAGGGLAGSKMAGSCPASSTIPATRLTQRALAGGVALAAPCGSRLPGKGLCVVSGCRRAGA